MNYIYIVNCSITPPKNFARSGRGANVRMRVTSCEAKMSETSVLINGDVGMHHAKNSGNKKFP